MANRSNASAPESPVSCVHCGDEHPAAFTHCPRTGKPLSAGRALIGRVIAERYRVTGLLGEGGMGAVYMAEHLLIGRMVALKRLHPELASDAKAVARFQREARAAAATGHDNIVDILDMGFGEDGAPFLVMEYLKGHSLAETLRSETRLAPTRAAFIVGQVLAGLAAVHGRDIVHRDLKPDNIFLVKRPGRSDHVKVLDFGISKMQRENESMALTRTGVTLGTPFYMSPEHARGVKGLDHRVDLYATGVMLYECLTGRVPYRDENYHALLQAILRAEPPPLHSLVPELDAGLAALVHRAIARDPRDRFLTAREMLLALVPYGAVDVGHDENDAAASPTQRPAGQLIYAPRSDIGSLDTEAHRLTTPAVRPSPVGADAMLAVAAAMTMRATGSHSAGSTPAPAAPASPAEAVREARAKYTAAQGAAQGAPKPARGDASGPVRISGPTPAPNLTARARSSIAPHAHGAATQVKASMIVAALEHLEKQHGRAVLDKITDELEPDARAIARSVATHGDVRDSPRERRACARERERDRRCRSGRRYRIARSADSAPLVHAERDADDGSGAHSAILEALPLERRS
jgi:Protein kinase domain